MIRFVYGSMTMSAAGAANASSKDVEIGFSSGTTGLYVTVPQSGTPAPSFLTGNALINNAIGTGATRTTAADVQAYLITLKP